MPRSDYQVVIGLEVHAQLSTRSKLFSGASTAFGAEPNAHTTAVCLGLPGALPVLNDAAVDLALRAGLALGCTVNLRSEWARKHYFYPDLPKGYQVTQYEHPICEWGEVAFDTPDGERRVRVRRMHMEEDAGKLVHDAVEGLSLVDLNRAGTPLVEIVSEPDLRSADDAVEYLKALRDILVAIGVNDGNLEEGSFRCDANVSVMKPGAGVFGTRCELKNLNSFRFVKEAIEAEAERQVDLLESGGQVAQQTRLYDAKLRETRAMRSKEDAHDYRYFPEPDLPPLTLDEARVARAKAALPELPRARRRRYVASLGLPPGDAQVLTAEPSLADLFDACVAEGCEPKRAANWLMGELSRLLNETKTTAARVRFTPAQLKALLDLVASDAISGAAAKDVFAVMFATGRAPADVVAEQGLAQTVDAGALDAAIDAVLAANEKNVAAFRAGNPKLLGFFVGQVMKALGGKANAKKVSQALVSRLGG